MTHFAALDPLLALFVAIGWFVIKALQSRRKDSESWDSETVPAPRPHVPDRGEGAPPPKINRPGRQALPPLARPTVPNRTPRQGNTPPPIPRPIVQTIPQRPPLIGNQAEGPTGIEFATLKESAELYARTSELDKAVAKRMAAIDKQTTQAKPTTPKVRTRSAVTAHVLRTMRNPITVRQAFLASFVLNPPKALE